MIPIHIKIYKLLISELSNAMETNMSQQASAGGEDLEVGFDLCLILYKWKCLCYIHFCAFCGNFIWREIKNMQIRPNLKKVCLKATLLSKT